MVDASKHVAVIGAGAGGLSAAKQLSSRGLEVTVFELGSHVGGLWVYENDNRRSPAYQSLHINSEAQVTHYLDFPFPAGTGLYPSHEHVRAYLEAYADRFDLRRHISFNTRVDSVEPVEGRAGRGWEVGLEHGTTRTFDAVVVATGHQAVPAHPAVRDDFAGEYLHSHSYRTPEPFRDQRVLIIGTGNSALDIAADICMVTEQTVVSARSPVLIMPRMMFGAPTARLLSRFGIPKAPWPVQRFLRELLTRVAYGPMEQWGFVSPKTRTHPASHPTFMSHVAYGRIRARPAISGVAGTEVRFVDGSAESFDAMIAATGYELDLPFLPDHIAPINGRRLDVYKRVVHPHWPGLYFVGFFNVSGGANIRMMDVQTEWVTALVTGEAGLPTPAQMLADLEREHSVIAKRYPSAPRYGQELDPLEYPAEIAAELRRPAGRPLPERLLNMTPPVATSDRPRAEP